MNTNYVVCVNDAPKAQYKTGHFPREFPYKKEAVAAAKEAIAFGASFARVECPNGGELDFRPDKPVKNNMAKKEKKFEFKKNDPVRDTATYTSGTVIDVIPQHNFPYLVRHRNGREVMYEPGELEAIPADELIWDTLPDRVAAAIDAYADAASDHAIAREAYHESEVFLAAGKEKRAKIKLAKILQQALLK